MKKNTQLLTYDAVKEKALRLLEFRSHSEKELCEKLRRHGASDEHIEMTLDFCRRYGFVNDEEYAKRKAADLLNLKKYGIRRIRSELKVKGIAEDIISSVLCSLDTEAEQTVLRSLVEKKIKNDFSQKNKDKCIRYFIYRGYDLYDIKNVLNLLEDEYEL